MSVMDIRVGKRAQMVIPATLRRQMGIEEGDLLHAEIDDEGRLVLERVDADPLAQLRQVARGVWQGHDPVEHQRELRAEWPA